MEGTTADDKLVRSGHDLRARPLGVAFPLKPLLAVPTCVPLFAAASVRGFHVGVIRTFRRCLRCSRGTPSV